MELRAILHNSTRLVLNIYKPSTTHTYKLHRERPKGQPSRHQGWSSLLIFARPYEADFVLSTSYLRRTPVRKTLSVFVVHGSASSPSACSTLDRKPEHSQYVALHVPRNCTLNSHTYDQQRLAYLGRRRHVVLGFSERRARGGDHLVCPVPSAA